MNILIVGDTEDLTAAYMGWRARKRGWQALKLREDQLGESWSIDFDDADPRAGRVEVGGRSFPMNEIDGAYVRMCPEPGMPMGIELDAPEQTAFMIERRHALQHWLNLAPFAVANRPWAGRSNGSKPYQMRLLSEAGFRVPKWLVTNEYHALARFEEGCAEGAIYKAASGLRSRVRRIDEALKKRLSAGTVPVVAQEYIPGRDVRVHVVAGEPFATAVKSAGVDYRFESDGNEFVPTKAPIDVLSRCYRVAEAEGLLVAGFDFRVTPDGHWYCLEVNPVPTFLPYEMATGQRIADAILDRFEAAREKPEPRHRPIAAA